MPSIELRRLSINDIESLVSIVDDQTASDARLQTPFDFAVAKNFIVNYNTWGVMLNTKLVGAIELKRTCEVAYFISPVFQNKGIATIALEIMTDKFANRQLVAYIHPNNKASLRVAQKAKLRVHFLK